MPFVSMAYAFGAPSEGGRICCNIKWLRGSFENKVHFDAEGTFRENVH